MKEIEIVYLKPKEVERVKAENGPSGAREAFQLLETRVPSLKGRSFYGVYYTSRNIYYAGVDFASKKFKELGFAKSFIPGGNYARRKILNWAEKIERVGSEFEVLENNCRDEGYFF